jgi:hemophore-related protein
MRTPTLVAVAGGGLAAALALGAAVPALASGATSSSTTATSATASASPDRTPLTDEELATIDQFFENHPVLGHRLVARIDAWKTFLDNHPNFAEKLQQWKALPPKQRRAEMHAWLADHPKVRHDLRALRADRRELRHDLRQLRRDLRP